MAQNRKLNCMFETKRDILVVILYLIVCLRTFNYWYVLSLITDFRYFFKLADQSASSLSAEIC